MPRVVVSGGGKVRTGKSVPKSKVSVFALLRCERTVCVAIKRVRRVILTPECVMKSLVIKRSVVLSGHKTSISLEDAFWDSLKEIAASRGMFLSALLTEVELAHRHGNLSSGIRLFVLNHYRGQSNNADMMGPVPPPSGRVPRQRPSLFADAEY